MCSNLRKGGVMSSSPRLHSRRGPHWLCPAASDYEKWAHVLSSGMALSIRARNVVSVAKIMPSGMGTARRDLHGVYWYGFHAARPLLASEHTGLTSLIDFGRTSTTALARSYSALTPSPLAVLGLANERLQTIAVFSPSFSPPTR